MASNCEDVSAQMMELLYGELPADARATVDAHVAGCARCRAELDGFEKTRALARRGLDEAPPARVHAAIMQAAAAHLATQAQAQPAAAARKPAAPETVSFWDRLRARWAFPTLATVGAVAVFMVANRVFLNPERTLEQRPARVETPAAPPAPEPGAGAEPKMQAEPKPAGEAQEEREARLDRRRGPGDDDTRAHHGKWAAGGEGRSEGKKAKKGGDAEIGFAAPPPAAARAEAPAKEKAKVARDAPAENKFAPPPPPREGAPAGQWADKAAAPLDDADLPRVSASRPAAAAAKPAPARKAPALAQGKDLDELIAGGSIPRGGAGTGSAKGALGGLAGPRVTSDGYGAGAAQPAPRPAPVAPVAAAPAAATPTSPPPAALAKSRAKKSEAIADEAFEPAPEATAAKSDAKEEKKVAPRTSANSGNDAIMQRADRLFADGRWAEAAALYRELLRRDPRNDDAERWRRRLVAAEAAEVNERNAAVAAKRAAPRQEKAEAPAKPAAKAAAKASKAAAAAADSAQ